MNSLSAWAAHSSFMPTVLRMCSPVLITCYSSCFAAGLEFAMHLVSVTALIVCWRCHLAMCQLFCALVTALHFPDQHHQSHVDTAPNYSSTCPVICTLGQAITMSLPNIVNYAASSLTKSFLLLAVIAASCTISSRAFVIIDGNAYLGLIKMQKLTNRHCCTYASCSKCELYPK